MPVSEDDWSSNHHLERGYKTNSYIFAVQNTDFPLQLNSLEKEVIF